MSRQKTDKSDFQIPACLHSQVYFLFTQNMPPELLVKMAALVRAMVSPSYPKFLLQNRKKKRIRRRKKKKKEEKKNSLF